MIRKNNKYNYAFLAFGINFLCAFFSLIVFVVLGDGILTLSNDFNAQELSFNMFANEAIKRGEIFWNWNIDLGSDFVTTFSFYNIGSPFFWITLLFKAEWFPYLAAWIYMLKYAVAGLTSYLYLRQFSSNAKVSVCCSVLYAFSGYQCANLVFYHFHDVVAFFPLMLLGLEIMMKKGKRGVFAFAVCINALVNYVFFVGEVIFVILYFCIRFLLEDWKLIKKVPMCIVEGALGTGMAGILFVPSCMSILNNSRVSSRLEGINMLLYPIRDYLWNIKAFLLPGDNMAKSAAVGAENWYSVSAYLPLVGIVLVLAYMIKRRNSWLTKMLTLCFVTAFVPILNSAYVMFNVEPYRRWYYMMILMMVLASQYVLEQRHEYPIKLCAYFTGIAILLLTVVLVIYGKRGNDIRIYRPAVYFGMIGIALAGVIITYYVTVKAKRFVPLLLCSVMGMSMLTTGMTIFTYRQNDEHASSKDTYNDVATGKMLEEEILPYRYEFWENYYNRGLAAYLPTRNSFSTTVSTSVFELYDMLGSHRHTIGVNGPEGTSELLGVGYYISNVELEEETAVGEFFNGTNNNWVYDRRQLPIGFAYETYMTRSEFLELNPEVRACAMLNSLIVEDKEEAEVKKILKHYEEAVDGKIETTKKQSYIDQRKAEVINHFEKDTTGFTAEIQTNQKKYVFFSVPYDKQWTVSVNGVEKDILNINGLMAVEADAGINTMVFQYSSLHLKLGLGISLLSLVTVLGWIFIPKRKEKK